jgi:hypothetical protein
MNRTFVISVIAVFVATMALDFVVHGLLLGEAYQRLVPNVFRSPEDSQRYFGYMLFAHVLIAVGWTWIYRMGREAKPWLGQGLRFGLAVAVISTIPTYFIYYAVQPLPSDLVAEQVVYSTIASLILGVVVAALNRDPIAPRT